MKYIILFITVFAFFSCDEKSIATENSNEITETTLPKGKYVIEDDIKSTNTETTELHGVNNADNKKTTVPADEAALLKRRFKNLLVFHANDTMKINKSYLATLILGKDQVLGSLRTEVSENSNTSNDEIKQDTSIEIGTKMKARLIDMSGADNKGFIIELIGGEDASTQSITEKRKKVMWQWKLTPQTPGIQELKLSVNIIEKDGETVNLPARNIPILIFAEKEGFFSAIGSFFKSDNTKWLLSAILIPFLLAWYNVRMKNKSYEKYERKDREKKD